MLVMEQEETQYFTPSEAVKYLREKRGIIVTVPGLRQRRKRGTAKTERVLSRIALWTKEELDAIKPSPRTRLVDEDEG